MNVHPDLLKNHANHHHTQLKKEAAQARALKQDNNIKTTQSITIPHWLRTRTLQSEQLRQVNPANLCKPLNKTAQ